jgi:16S rRNA (cytosine967-C5)-methyltransferase
VLGKGDAGHDPAFLAGQFSIQDEASQLVVELLDPQPGERILETCAAPGTKTAGIAERLDGVGHVLALDRHARRLRLIGRGIRRLGLGGVATLECDASRPLDRVAEQGLFDRILVDAPCSGLGSLRRNPDARWRIKPEDFGELASLQRALLESAAAVLRPGGSLVYSTCTVTPEENEAVIRGFLATRASWQVAGRDAVPAGISQLLDENGMLRLLPHRHDMDGFFAVRLVRGESGESGASIETGESGNSGERAATTK